MLRVYTGLPRTGKSYLAVKNIAEDFIGSDYFASGSFFSRFINRPKSIKYNLLLTNINGFKHDEVNDYFDNQDIERKSMPLDWPKFYHHVKTAYDMDMSGADDDELISYFAKYGLINVLLVVDEAHKYFTKKRDEVLVWFLGYHGHLSFDIWLITQNKKKIASDYLADCEIFIDAQSKSKSLSDSHLRYFYYASDSYTKEQRFQKKTVKTSQDIYALYKSGDIHKPPKIVYRFLGIIAFLLVAVAFMFKFFLSHFAGAENLDDTNIDENRSIEYRPVHREIGKLYRIVCDEDGCYNADPKYKSITYPLDYVYFVLDSTDKQILYKSTVNNVYQFTYLPVTNKKVFYSTNTYYLRLTKDFVTRNFPDWLTPYKNSIRRHGLFDKAAEAFPAAAALGGGKGTPEGGGGA